MKVYVLNVERLNQENLFQRAYETVDSFRKRKIDACRVKGERIRILGAGLLLAYSVSEAFNCPWEELKERMEMGYGAYGKPYLKEWKGICFNLSHSGSYAACVVSGETAPFLYSREKEVGIDIQQVLPSNLKVAKRAFSNEEYKRLEEVCMEDEQGGRLLFAKMWTKKESRGKLLGTGIFVPEQEKEPESPIYIRTYGVTEEYILSVAAREKKFPEAVCELVLDEVLGRLNETRRKTSCIL